MDFAQLLQLLAIAATWGASHVFARIAVPGFGPQIVAFSRILIAAIFMMGWVFSRRGLSLSLRENLRPFLLMGFLYSAVPFSMFAWASIVLPASYLSILNSTVPLFSAIFSAIFLAEGFGIKKIMTLVLGLSGVILLEEYGALDCSSFQVILAFFACILAVCCYALGGIYVKKKAAHIRPEVLSAGASASAALMLFPLLFWAAPTLSVFDFHSTETLKAWGCVFMLGIFSSALAFLLYYRLIAKLGAFKASLVTFLMPVFGLLWGALFLGEPVNGAMILGSGMILMSTALCLKRPQVNKQRN